MIIGFDGSRVFIEEKTGTENYSFQLLKALLKIDRKNKYKVYINPYRVNSRIDLINLISNQIPSTKSQLDHLGIGNFLGQLEQLEIRNFKFKIIPWPRLWTQAGLALQTFKDPLDVLFVSAHTLPIIRKPDLKTVVTVHDLGSEYLPGMHQLKQRLYLSFMQKVQLRGATKIIAVSRATKKDLIKRVGIDPRKVEVVYEGYDNKLFRPVKSDMLVYGLRQYGLKLGSYFLFVGTVQPRKNLERVIIAFSCQLLAIRQKNKKSDYLVIVGLKGWLSDDIYKLPKRLGIENKVKFLGYVEDKDLPALYSQAIALLFPSLFEGFGLPILEAQACGCPVLTSNISSMPEVAGEGAILVNPYDVDEIANAMIKVKGEAERGKLVKAGFENIKRFSWEKCARETLGVLMSV